MKKVLAICLMMLMVVSMNITALANPGAFVSSPSGNPAPELVSFKPSDDGCSAQLVIAPYSKRGELPADLKALLEKAYDEIVKSLDLTQLNADLAKVAADKKIDGTDLAVSDLFDLYVTSCEEHEGHIGFDIVLKADTLKHFVGLLHMNKNGEWELVSDAEIDGEHLKFSVDTLSPFAIVVDTNLPQTGDSSMIHIYAIIMAVAALTLIVVCISSKKKNI